MIVMGSISFLANKFVVMIYRVNLLILNFSINLDSSLFFVIFLLGVAQL